MKCFSTIFLLLIASALAFSQTGAPKKFNYQAVPRKADGTLFSANTTLKIQFVIKEDGAGNIKYGEEHTATVSQHGVVSAIVGGGTASGTLPFDFDALDWKNHSYYLAVAVDINGDGAFEGSEQFASSQLLSVPYALYAEQTGSDVPDYIWGEGLAIDPGTATISNTGDLNGNDDVLKNSLFVPGDVTGTFNDGLEIKPNAVSSAEIANQSIQLQDLAAGVIPTTLPPGGAASGDLNGTYPSPQVDAIQGFSVSAAAPANGQVLKWSGTAWAPATDATGTPGGGDNWGAQTAATTLPITGDGTSGSPIGLAANSVNSSHITNGSITQTALAAGVIPTTLPPNGAASGDLDGTYPAPKVDAIQGFSVSAAAPANGQVLKWNGTVWAPATDATGTPGGGDNWGAQTAATTLPITGDGTSGSPIGLALNSVNGSHIANGSITQTDLAAGTIPTVTAGTAISLNPTANGYSIVNTNPDQPITLSGTGATTVSGNYPNFTINTPNTASGIGGSGTGGYIPKFSAATTLGNSTIYQSGNNVGIGTTNPTGNLDINGGVLAMHNGGNAFNMALRSDGKLAFEANGISGNNTLVLHNANNSVSIGTALAPLLATDLLHVSGNIRCSGINFVTSGIYFGGVGTIDVVGALVPEVNGMYWVGQFGRRWGGGWFNKIYSSEFIIAGTTSADDQGASLRVVGAENDGSNAAVRIESGSQTMTLDGNEIDASVSGLYLNNNSSGNVVLAAGGGKVNIGDVTASSGLLNVQGTAYKTGGGSWSSFSDRRLKEKIAPFSAGIDLLNKINPVTFHYNGKLGMSNVPEYVGVIAQELQAAAPFMVTETAVTEGPEAGQTYLGVDPSAFTYILINAVKTQQTEISNLKSQLETQQAQINALLSGFEQLKAEVAKVKAKTNSNL
ncbi:MAG: tail fiber domain-containing protein [Saprospiraceae bacterium]|nr:tail fiber domain-containing protein [Saprospiraceae bacterium]